MPPEVKTTTKVKPGKSGFLTKKVGPFSTWVYLVAIGGGVAVWWFFLRGRGGGDAGYGGPEVVSGGSAASPEQMASAGAPSANGAPADQLSPDVMAQLQDTLAQIGDVRGHVTELEDAISAQGYTLNDDKTWSVPGITDPFFGSGDVIDTPTTQGTGSAAGGGGGVHWGGNIYKTKRGIANELAAHGVSYGDWARKHPNAAASLTGPAPVRVPKKKAGQPGKNKTTQRHPAAAAHPAAHPGAHRNTHPAPAKHPAGKVKPKAKKKPAPTARGRGRGRK